MQLSSKLSSRLENKRDSGVFGRCFLFVFASFYTVFFVGALFGWGPMQRLLESSGAFHFLCNDPTEAVCVAQSTAIINLNFIASTTNTVTPLIGQAIDKLGAPLVAYCMSAVAVTGSALLVVASQFQIDNLYYLAFCLMGIATFTGSLLSVQVGLYFNGMTQVRVIMFLNALFDAGSVTYLLLWGIKYFFSYSFADVMKLYLCLAIVVYGGAVYFWKTAVPEEVEEEEEDKVEEAVLLSNDINAFRASEVTKESLRVFQMSHMDTGMLQGAFLSLRGSARQGADQMTLASLYGSTRFEVKQDEEAESEYIPIAQRSPRDQLLSVPFLSLTFFFAISMTSCNWSLTTAADFLADLGDDGTYLSIFTLMQPASILSLPIVDATVNNLGFGAAFQVVNTLNFVYILEKVLVHNLNAQIFHFILVAVVRCYLYAVTFSFLPSLLSSDVVGKGTGFLYLVGGLVSFANIPLIHWAAKVGFLFPNLMYLSLVFPCVVMVRLLQRTLTKEAQT